MRNPGEISETLLGNAWINLYENPFRDPSETFQNPLRLNRKAQRRPLSRDELKAKTLRGLTKREGQQMSKQAKRKGRKDNKIK